MECYFIVSPQPLIEPESSDGTVRHSSIELYNLFKRGTLLLSNVENVPKSFIKVAYRFWNVLFSCKVHVPYPDFRGRLSSDLIKWRRTVEESRNTFSSRCLYLNRATYLTCSCSDSKISTRSSWWNPVYYAFGSCRLT